MYLKFLIALFVLVAAVVELVPEDQLGGVKKAKHTIATVSALAAGCVFILTILVEARAEVDADADRQITLDTKEAADTAAANSRTAAEVGKQVSHSLDELKKHLLEIAEDSQESLTEEFPLGYGIVYQSSGKYVYVDRQYSDFNFDWTHFDAEIGPEMITIVCPDVYLAGRETPYVQQMRVSFPKEAKRQLVALFIGFFEMEARVLESTSKGTAIAMGLRPDGHARARAAAADTTD